VLLPLEPAQLAFLFLFGLLSGPPSLP
jgi:hypothetical protein